MTKWVDDMFRADAVLKEGIVRRQKSDVNNMGVLPEIIDRAKANDWHVLESETQYIVLCNSGQLQILC